MPRSRRRLSSFKGMPITDEYARRSAEFALQTIAPEELEKDAKTRTHKPPTVLYPIDYARWHEVGREKNVQRKERAE